MATTARALAVLIAVLALGAQAAQAATTIHVPADQPTVQAAVNAASAGDTVAVAAGTYAEHVTVTKDLTITGDGGPAVGTAAGGFSIMNAHVAITGFTVSSAGTGTGIDVAGVGSSVVARGNRFTANATAVHADTGTTADAKENWYGCNGGPGASGCQPVTGPGDVQFAPFLTLSVAPASGAIGPGATTSVVASLRRDSAGTDLGAIAVGGGAVSFAATGGTIPASAALVQGAASATFTAPSAPGGATVTATLDSATVSAEITVLRPDADGDGIADDVDCAPADASKPAKGVADADCDGVADPTPPASGGTKISLVLNTITGSTKADTLTGTDAAELILGLAGDDLLRGGKGNDRLFGGDGNDRVYGDAGDDRVNGGPGDDRVEGGDGNDVLEGSSGRDKMVGGKGDDVIVGGSGADQITAHSGDDVVRAGTGNDTVDTRDGKAGDIVACGRGYDRVTADAGDVVAKDCERVTRGKATSSSSKKKH